MNTPRQRSSAKRNGKATTPSAVPSQTPALLPALDDRNGWQLYWKAQGQPWREEPEIDIHRQEELAKRREILPDVEKGIYPFKGMKLSRADVEWLLATHENGRGPVDWNNESERGRAGLDFRGADLSHLDLYRLPLGRLRGGLMLGEWENATEEQREAAGILLTGAKLKLTNLTGAILRKAHLEGADLYRAYLERAHLDEAHLENASLVETYLDKAHLLKITLSDKNGVGPYVVDAHWNGSNLAVVKWSQVEMLGDEQVARQRRHKGRVKDRITRLEDHERAVRANRQLAMALRNEGVNEDASRFEYRAQVLQKSIYRFQMFQHGAPFKKQIQTLSVWLFSWFLFLIAGYGYKPSRSFLAYLLVISGFATAYYFLGHTVGPTLSPLGAFVFSMTSFHGRGFFPGNNISLDDPLTVLAAFEALVGLIIEVTFIATLTQRFFNR